MVGVIAGNSLLVDSGVWTMWNVKDIDRLRYEALHQFAPISLTKETNTYRAHREWEKRRSRVNKVLDAYKIAILRGDTFATKEQAVESIGAIMFPILIRWLLYPLFIEIVEWIFERLTSDEPAGTYLR